MAVDKAIVNSQVAFTSTADVAANLGGVQRVLLRAVTNDCYVDFDQPVAASQSARINTSDTGYTIFEVPGGTIQQLHVRGVSGNGTLHITAIIN